MASYNEYEGLLGDAFTPFDDRDSVRLAGVIAISEQSGSGYGTSEIDPYRQGVEITSPHQLYRGNQPKLWSGNLSHAIRIVTYGQARSWTEYENTKIFDDQVQPFDQESYIESPETYPMPIYLNDGPQSEEEAIVEPLTIPFRKSPQEGARPARSPKGALEDGNGFDSPVKAANRILQFVEYDAPLTQRYFLDAGQEYVTGNSSMVSGSIRVEGYVAYNERLGTPFNDTCDERIVAQIDTSDSSFITALKALKIELDEDIRETYTQKSANAGGFTYGPEQGRYGTDSIAFIGTMRGS